MKIKITKKNIFAFLAIACAPLGQFLSPMWFWGVLIFGVLFRLESKKEDAAETRKDLDETFDEKGPNKD